MDGAILEKLKLNISEVFKVDEETKLRARFRFQYVLYAKLFGKAPAVKYVKISLLGQWQDFGRIMILDMPNGFMLIRCESDEVKQNIIIFGGPWNFNEMTLQISLWQPYFEPATTKLSKAMVWVQLHNLSVEFWEGDALESITETLGRLLKVDELMTSISRVRFARVCLEMDLSLPMKREILA